MHVALSGNHRSELKTGYADYWSTTAAASDAQIEIRELSTGFCAGRNLADYLDSRRFSIVPSVHPRTPIIPIQQPARKHVHRPTNVQ